jgi:alkanesulfonate monooxygenase SsuD/methylene tetrahydromethanopterin reductase-like flavin-dependent oxidoreductase (luciferase family)
MEIAVWDTFYPRAGVAAADHYDQLMREVEAAEDCGFAHYWFLEHHFNPRCPVPSPNLLIAAAARATRRIRLGAMVNILPFRSPAILAQEIAMLDNLTRGRLDVGIGRGLNPKEFATLGIDQAASRAMFLEAMEVMLGAWSDGTFSHRGRYFALEKQAPLSPPLLQHPHPPLYVSAQSEESLRFAAAHGLPFGQIDALPEDCRRDVAFYCEAARACGRDPQPRLFLTREVFIAETDREARRDAYQYLLGYWELWGRYAQFTRDGVMPEAYNSWLKRAPLLAAMSYEELVERNMLLIGAPDTVAAQLRALTAELDIAILACVFHLGGLPHEQVMRSMQLFASEVLPRARLTQAAHRTSGSPAPISRSPRQSDDRTQPATAQAERSPAR